MKNKAWSKEDVLREIAEVVNSSETTLDNADSFGELASEIEDRLNDIGSEFEEEFEEDEESEDVEEPEEPA